MARNANILNDIEAWLRKTYPNLSDAADGYPAAKARARAKAIREKAVRDGANRRGAEGPKRSVAKAPDRSVRKLKLKDGRKDPVRVVKKLKLEGRTKAQTVAGTRYTGMAKKNMAAEGPKRSVAKKTSIMKKMPTRVPSRSAMMNMPNKRKASKKK